MWETCSCLLEAPPPGSLADFPGQAVLTPEATPASDITGIVLRQQGTFLWDTGHLDGVAQLHRRSQLDDGNVIPGTQSGGLAGEQKAGLSAKLWWPGIPHRHLPAAS